LLQKDGFFQISEQESPRNIGQQVSCEIWTIFIYKIWII